MRILPLTLVLLLVVFGAGLALTALRGDDPGAGRAAGRNGAAAPSAPVSTKPQGHVYTGLTWEPADVNPWTTHDPAARAMVLAVTHDTLLDRDPADGSIRPALAAAYEVAPDHRSCVFTLRDGVVFADGAPLTMADVLFGWELARAGHLPLGYAGAAFGRVADVEVVDDRRFRVHFRTPHYAVAEVVGESWIVGQRDYFVGRVAAMLEPGEPAPEVASARFADLLDAVQLQCGPGTGPYLLRNEPGLPSGWRPGEELQLDRNDASWRRAARPDTWNLAGFRLLFRDPSGWVNALLRREVDWYPGPNPDELLAAHPDLGQDYRKLVYDFSRLGVFRIVWNCRRVPFDDERVRRALGMLVPRDQIVQKLGGAAVPAAAHAKPGAPEYPSSAPLPFDPPGARSLLREVGYDPNEERPLEVALVVPAGSAPLQDMANLIAAAAKDAGVKLELRYRAGAALDAEKARGEWDGLLGLQYFENLADPHYLLHSQGIANDGGWRDAEADRLVEAAQVEWDEARRIELWRQLHQLAHERQPATLVVHPKAVVLLNVHVQDSVPGPLGLNPERAWVPDEFQRK